VSGAVGRRRVGGRRGGWIEEGVGGPRSAQTAFRWETRVFHNQASKEDPRGTRVCRCRPAPPSERDRADAAGEVLETVQIANDPVALAEVVARSGESPEVVLEACYGWADSAGGRDKLVESLRRSIP
jgi:hypothetical protein